MIAQIVVAILILSGGIFCFAAGLGVLRLSDLLTRMHASTKAGTLGTGLILVAVAVHFAESTVVARAIAAIVFLLLTAPVAAHLIGRAAFRSGVAVDTDTACDDGVAQALRELPPELPPEDATGPARPRASKPDQAPPGEA